MFIMPHEIAQIERDVSELLGGADSCDVILRWTEGDAQPDVYGKKSDAKDMQETLRAHVTVVANPTGLTRQIQKQTNQDVQSADIVLLFDRLIDLNRTGLWFEVEGLGQFVPEAKPPHAGSTRPTLMLEGKTVLTEIYCRLKR